jgi:hypothetical protein
MILNFKIPYQKFIHFFFIYKNFINLIYYLFILDRYSNTIIFILYNILPILNNLFQI